MNSSRNLATARAFGGHCSPRADGGDAKGASHAESDRTRDTRAATPARREDVPSGRTRARRRRVVFIGKSHDATGSHIIIARRTTSGREEDVRRADDGDVRGEQLVLHLRRDEHF
jgi:hypothetical protein